MQSIEECQTNPVFWDGAKKQPNEEKLYGLWTTVKSSLLI